MRSLLQAALASASILLFVAVPSAAWPPPEAPVAVDGRGDHATEVWRYRAGSANRASLPQVVQAPSAQVIRLVGTLERGVECWVVRAEGGTLYSIGAAQPAGIVAGERVRVEGRLMGASFCMQGIPLRVERIEKAN